MAVDWTAMAARWLAHEAEVEASHQAVLDQLIARADLRIGQSVLDIGCGMGSSLLAVKEQVGATGQILGVDISPPMVGRAAARLAGSAQVVVGDAQSHAFETGRFDAAVSLFGMMFFSDPQAAFANILTAMRPGARLTFACWGTPLKNQWFATGRRIAVARLGAPEPVDPLAPGPFAFADPDRVIKMLTASGWGASVQSVDMYLKPRGTPEEVADLQMKFGAASRLIDELQGNDADRAFIRAELADAFQDMQKDGQVHVPAHIHYFTALAPG